MNINSFLASLLGAFFFCFLQIEICTAQTIYSDFGARSKGIGHSNTAMVDEWAVFNNAAGISGVENGSVIFGYDRFFKIEGFNRVGAAVIQPFNFGTFGVSAFRFGDELLSEQIFSTAFSNKIGFVRLGARANYYQIRIEESGTASSFYLDFGGIVELIPDLTFGAFISNLTVSKLSNPERTKLPVLMKLGLSYQPTDEITFNMDIHKDVEFDPLFKMGLEYKIMSKVCLRTGINTNPFQAFFGAGLVLDRFTIDYAVGSQQFLGMSHQASIAFKYQK